jgi:lysine-N-methylase
MTILHHVKTLQALVPAYTTRFQCLGSECSDSCCSGWTVSIDKRTHEAYKRIQDPVLTPLIQTKLERTRANTSDGAYSRIALDSGNGDCPFLENALCSIQSRLGEDKLSHTCFQYPRQTKQVAGVRQQAMTLSCPRAAQLALDSCDAMEILSLPISVRSDSVIKQSQDIQLLPDIVNSVRFALIRLVRVESVPLWQRLASLAVACEVVQDYSKQGKSVDLPVLLGHFEATLSSGTFSKALDDLRPDYLTQSVVLGGIWGLQASRGGSQSQNRVQTEVTLGLGITPSEPDGDATLLVRRYQIGISFLNTTLGRFPWLLTNFVVNEMFRDVFPFGMQSPLDHYRILVIKYGVLRLMLAARCAYLDRPLTKEEVAETTQVFARHYEHWSGLSSYVEKVLKSAHLTSTADLYRFLKCTDQ